MFLFISVFQYFSAFVGKQWVNQFLANVPILHPLKTLARNDLTQCFPVFCNKYRIILETISNNWENLQEMGKLILAKLQQKITLTILLWNFFVENCELASFPMDIVDESLRMNG